MTTRPFNDRFLSEPALATHPPRFSSPLVLDEKLSDTWYRFMDWMSSCHPTNSVKHWRKFRAV